MFVIRLTKLLWFNQFCDVYEWAFILVMQDRIFDSLGIAHAWPHVSITSKFDPVYLWFMF